MTLTASDSSIPAQQVSSNFYWSVAGALQITNRSLPAAVAGKYTFSATGGYPPYSNWAVASGALPPGWTLNASAGSISAPTADNSSAFSLTVQDSYGNVSAPRAYSTAIPAATTDVLTLSAAPSILGQPQTLTATVTPSAATGTVTFFDGTAIVGTSSLLLGQASVTTRLLAQGPHKLRAIYPGSQSYAASTSPVIARTVADNPESGLRPAVNYSTAPGPLQTLVGDFNGDGIPDLAVSTSSGSNTGIDILPGRGDGTFLPAIHTVAPGGFITAGDFNGDGKLDIAYTNLTQSVVYVQPGNGDGTFQPAAGYSIAGPGQSIAVGDFNGDGIPDIASLPFAGGVSVLIGNGDGTFYQGGTQSGAATNQGIVAADFNGDGIPDMATTTLTPASVTVFLSNGDGTFKSGVAYSGTYGPLTAGDFNGDGFVDLATSAGILLGNGDGTFRTQQTYPGGITGDPLVGDFNGDGKADVAIAGGNGLSLLYGRGDGTFGSPVSYPAGATFGFGILGGVADFNGDGRADIAIANSSGNSVEVLLGLPPLTLSCVPAGSLFTTVAASVPCTASGGTSPYTFSIASGTLPPGLMLTGAAISGTPTAAGSYTFTVQVTDSSNPTQTAVQSVTLTVNAGLTVNASFPPSGITVGVPIVPFALVSGGTPPYVCTQSLYFPLPPGISLNSATCVLSGTPTTPGTYSSGFTVSDSGTPPEQLSPSVNWSVANAVEITNRVLPSLVNGAYTFKAAGGQAPYTWALTSGALPQGWTLNSSAGTITAPTPNTTATFALTAQDSAGRVSAPRTFVTAARSAATVTLSLSAAPSTYGHPVTLTAAVTPAAATGLVSFFDGTAFLGSGILSAGQATLTTRLLAQGPRSLRAIYEGTSAYLPATSAAVARTIGASPQSGFRSPANYPTSGAGPAVIGDFNGDGNADFAVFTASGIDVFLGSGNGTFGAAVQTASSGGGPLIAADFNGDGKLDLAYNSPLGYGLSVQLGNGDGTFQPAVGYQGAYLALNSAVGDFNGDGIPDIASNSRTSNSVTILLGNGDGSFYQSAFRTVTVPSGAPTTGFAVADFNRDGFADVAITVYPSTIVVFLGNGDGTLQPGVTYTGTTEALATGDFNGDGIPDLATRGGILLGNGDGTFKSEQPYPSGLQGTPTVADFNGDGKQDILIATSNTQGTPTGLTLLIGNGDGTFTAQATYSGAYTSAAVADVNGDGLPDMVASTSGGGVNIFLGLAPLTITCTPAAGPVYTGAAWSTACSAAGGTSPYTWSISSGTLPAGLSLNASTGAISGVPTGSGSYTFTVQATDSSNPTQTALQPVTVTVNAGLTVNASFPPSGTTVGVPISPISLASGGTSPYTCTQTGFSTLPPGITLNSATCVLSGTPTTPGSYSLALAVADSGTPPEQISSGFGAWVVANAVEITNRTLPPLVSGVYNFSAAGGTPPYSNWTLTSGALPQGWTLNSSAGTISAPTPNTTATFALTAQDSAGRVSAPRTFVTAARSAATVTLSLSAAPSTYGHPVTLTAAVTPAAATGLVSFFDGTAFLGSGILSAGQATLTTRLLAQGPRSLRAVYIGSQAYTPATSAAVARNIGVLPQSGFTPPVNYTTAYVSSTVPGDFNGDGNSDLAISTANGIGVLPGNGDGTFGAAIVSPGGNESYLIAADFNGDGKLDIASASVAASAVYVQLGNGDGTFQPALGYPGNGMGLALAVADFNGDGIPDIAFDSQAGVTVLLGNGDGSFNPAGYRVGPGAAGFPAGGFVAGDFNRDGFADVAITVAPSHMIVFLGNGDGTLQPGVIYAGTAGGLAIGDFNGDSISDLATKGGILIGNGDGTFKSEQPYPSGLLGTPTVADFNGDGKQDILIATSNTQGTPTGLTLLIGNGDGTFTAQATYSGAYASTAVSDFNGDGRPDIAASTSTGASILLGLAPLTITCAPATGPVYTGTSWSTACPAAGGTSPYTWSISSGTLPAGLSLNASTGAISGVPTGSGSYAFTVQALDSSQPIQTATQAFSGTLSAPPTTGGGGGGGFLPPAASTLSAAPASLTFNSFPGNPPAAQTFSISSTAAGTSFSAGATTNGGGTWLSVSPTSGQTDTQGTLTVSVNPAGLGQGTYTGTVNVNSSQGGIASVAVTLNVEARISVSPSSLSFVYSLGDPAPSAQGVSVFSTPSGVPLAAAASQNPGEHWLTVGAPNSSSAPASIPVSINPAGLVAGTYTANVVVSSSQAAPVNVPVTLSVVSATPKLTVSPATQSFALTQGSPATQGQLTVSNAGGGTLQFTASSSPAGSWLTVSGSGGTATSSTPAALGFSVNPAGLAPGQYTGQITVTDSASKTQATATVILTVSPAAPSISLSQTGLTFSAIAGAQKLPAQSVTVTNAGTGALNWTAQSTAPWLSVSQAGTTLSALADASTLSAGPYYGQINIAAAGAANSPQTISVFLNVAPAGQTSNAVTFSSGGLLVSGVAGGKTPQQTQIALYNASNSTVNFTAAPFTSNGIAWLSISSASGPLPPGTTTLTVSTDLSSLPQGVQTGAIRFAFDNGATGAVDVTALVSGSSHALPSSVCPSGQPSFLLPIFRQPIDQSSLQAGVAQRVQLQVVDDCGNALTSGKGGTVRVAFGNGDAPISLSDNGNGIWEATWLPTAAGSPVTLQATASEQTPGLASVSSGIVASGISLTVMPAAANAPGLVSGVVNAASAAQAVPQFVAPGSYVAIYGSGLAGSGSPLATNIPLPTSLNGTQLFLGGQAMPLLYASSGQVNALVPQSLNPNTAYQLVVARGSTLSVPIPLTVAAVQPAIYTQNLSGSGQGIVEIAGTSLLAAPAAASSRPAQRGSDYLVVFATGLGAVVGSNGEAPPADGAGAPLGTVYQTVSPVTATLGGVNAPVVFAGLTPSLVGLYQVNVQVTPAAPAGSAVPLSLSVNSISSNIVTVAVQ
jgi:uncharacterized protein (TIGR03437 family)